MPSSLLAMSNDHTASASAGGLGFLFLLLVLFYAALIAFSVYVYVRIARKAGYSGWYAALLFVPFVNLVVMVMFAFVEWPVERALKQAQAAAGTTGLTAASYGPAPGGYQMPGGPSSAPPSPYPPAHLG